MSRYFPRGSILRVCHDTVPGLISLSLERKRHMYKKLNFIFAFLLCFFLLGAIAGSDAKVQVAQARDRWLAAFKSKNVDQAISYYASDAAFLQPTGDRIEGIAAIRELYNKVASTFDSDLLVRSHNLEVSANLAFDSGEYEEILTDRATAQKQHFRGQYVMVFRLSSDGHWKIIQHVWTVAPNPA
jgi:ketosteroid isomerase-like protein